MNKKERVEAIRRAFHQLSALDDRYAGWSRSLVDRAYDAALAGEKQHNRGRPSSVRRAQASHDIRAKYFVVKWASEPFKAGHGSMDYYQASQIRDDAFLAYALRDKLTMHCGDSTAARDFREWANQWGPVIAQIDYSEHLS